MDFKIEGTLFFRMTNIIQRNQVAFTVKWGGAPNKI
jgi:hypothetical protein